MAEMSQVSDGRDEPTGFRQLSPDQWHERYVEFLMRSARSQLVWLVSVAPEVAKSTLYQDETALIDADDAHVGFEVNCQDLVAWDPKLCSVTLSHPNELLPVFDRALRTSQERLLQSRSAVGRSDWRLREQAHVRLSHVPPLAEHWKTNISALRASDVGPIVQVGGTVVRTGAIKMLETCRTYQCRAATCGAVFRVEADREQGNVLEKPTSCRGESKCASRKFAEISRENADYQELRVQEHVDQLAIGSIPRAVTVVVQDDLADACKAGDDVVVVGRVMRRWKPVHRDVRCDLELAVLANSLRVVGASSALTGGSAGASEEDKAKFRAFWRRSCRHPLCARDAFVASVCPQIYGRRVVKLAILLTLIGGVGASGDPASASPAEHAHDSSKQNGQEGSTRPSKSRSQAEHAARTDSSSSADRRRGTPHLLLVGDPGTGKSQFLRFVVRLAPRSVLTTGCGTTSAGLTCSAVREDGEWTLEAGALVLADKGICCIDEFAAMRESDRATIHEAMEQQTLSIAKAGLVCKLSTRASIIAVCNPKGGKYDKGTDLSVNTSLPPPLLSRFDVVLVVEDVADRSWDHAVSTSVLNAALADGETELGLEDSDEDADSLRDVSHQDDDLYARAGTCQPLHPHNVIRNDTASFDTGAKRRRVNGASSESPVPSKRHKSQAHNTSDFDGIRWNTDDLRKYIVHVKGQFEPNLDQRATLVLSNYYSAQRAQAGAARGRATIRMLESLIRLAQAHARLMYRNKVQIQDAVIACLLVDQSTGSSAVFDASIGAIPEPHEDIDSDEYYCIQEKHVCETLKLGFGGRE